MMYRGQFAQALVPGLHAKFLHWIDLAQRESEWDKLFHDEKSESAWEDEIEFAGLGAMPVKEEGASVIYDDGIQGGVKRYLHSTYGLGCRVSMELYEDDKIGLIMQIPKSIAWSAQFSIEINAMNILNSGFSSTGTVVQDGLSLFNNQHPLLGGTQATNLGPGLSNIISAAGTYPNRPATDLDLSITAIQLAINQFERLVNARGFPVAVKPETLVVPPELQWIATEMLGSSHKPYTSDNEVNAILKHNLSFFVSHYTTSQTAWFLLAPKTFHQLKVFNRKSLTEDYADDFDTRAIKMLAFMRKSYGASNWLGTWGSNGP